MAVVESFTKLGRHTWGDKVLSVYLIEGGTTFKATDVGLRKIENIWFQDVDDGNPIQVSVYAGDSVTFEEIGTGTFQIAFVVGD
jgi:hypothetical protein